MLSNLLLYFVLLPTLLLLFLATISFAIISLAYKGPYRKYWIDALLVVTTLSIGTTFIAEHFAKTVNGQQPAQSLGIDYHTRATFIADDLTKAAYGHLIANKGSALTKSNSRFNEDIDQAYHQLHALLRKHPHDTMLLACCAVACQESGRDAAAFLLPEKDRNDQTINSLYALYSGRDDTLDKAQACKLFRKTLPAGWLQQCALTALYKNGPPSELATIKLESNRALQNWAVRYQIRLAFNVLFVIFGIISLTICIKRIMDSVLPPFPNYSFRAVYGCCLVFISAQIIAAFSIAFISALAKVLFFRFNHSQLHLEHMSLWLQAATLISVLIFCPLAIHYFVCRPMGSSLKSFFTAHKLSPKQFAITSFAGFCAVAALSRLSAALSHHMSMSGPPRELDLQILQNVLSGNPLVIACTVFAVCLLGPIIEELLFRGLVYSWLRRHCVLPLAIAIDACLFALCHNNLPHFFAYCALATVLAIVYEYKRNLPCLIAIHGLWNAWAILSAVTLLPK